MATTGVVGGLIISLISLVVEDRADQLNETMSLRTRLHETLMSAAIGSFLFGVAGTAVWWLIGLERSWGTSAGALAAGCVAAWLGWCGSLSDKTTETARIDHRTTVEKAVHFSGRFIFGSAASAMLVGIAGLVTGLPSMPVLVWSIVTGLCIGIAFGLEVSDYQDDGHLVRLPILIRLVDSIVAAILGGTLGLLGATIWVPADREHASYYVGLAILWSTICFYGGFAEDVCNANRAGQPLGQRVAEAVFVSLVFLPFGALGGVGYGEIVMPYPSWNDRLGLQWGAAMGLLGGLSTGYFYGSGLRPGDEITSVTRLMYALAGAAGCGGVTFYLCALSKWAIGWPTQGGVIAGFVVAYVGLICGWAGRLRLKPH